MDKANKNPNPISSPEVVSKKRRTGDDNNDFSKTAPLPSINSSQVPSSSAGRRPNTAANEASDNSVMNRSK